MAWGRSRSVHQDLRGVARTPRKTVQVQVTTREKHKGKVTTSARNVPARRSRGNSTCLGGRARRKLAAQPLPRAWRLIDSWAEAPPRPTGPGTAWASRRRTYVRLAGTPVTVLCSQRHRSGEEVPFSPAWERHLLGQIAILCLLASPPARLLHDDKIGCPGP